MVTLKSIQRDLLITCLNKKIAAEYSPVYKHTRGARKYDDLTTSEIDEVVIELRRLYRQIKR